MLIAYKYKFIFIANPKTASTAIEFALRPFSEVCFMEPYDLNHISFTGLKEKFSWIFEAIPQREFFVFGAIRDPVDLLISLYNFHAADAFEDRPEQYTGKMTFDEFLADWCSRHAYALLPQYQRFVDSDGSIAANFLMSYGNLKSGFEYVKSVTGTQSADALPSTNTSDYIFYRRDLTDRQLGWIEHRFKDDIEFMRLYCDRPLTAEDAIGWSAIASTGR